MSSEKKSKQFPKKGAKNLDIKKLGINFVPITHQSGWSQEDSTPSPVSNHFLTNTSTGVNQHGVRVTIEI